MSPQARVAIGRPLRVLGAPAMPTQRSRVIGWSIIPSTGSPLCRRAMSVPNSGLPGGRVGVAGAGGRWVTKIDDMRGVSAHLLWLIPACEVYYLHEKLSQNVYSMIRVRPYGNCSTCPVCSSQNKLCCIQQVLPTPSSPQHAPHRLHDTGHLCSHAAASSWPIPAILLSHSPLPLLRHA